MAERDYLDWLRGLLEAVSPQEAEAKVVAIDPQAQALMDAVKTGAVMPGTREKDPLVSGRFDPLRKKIYRDVLQSAEERPETVYVGTMDHPIGSEGGGLGGRYTSGDMDTIGIKSYKPFYSASNRYTDLVPTAVNYQDVLSHELVHFLLAKIVPEIVKQGPQPWFHDFILSKYPDEYQKIMGRGYGRLTSHLLGKAEGEHEFIGYLQGLSQVPIETGPTGQNQPSLSTYTKNPPFMLPPRDASRIKHDIYTEALNRILRDPTLLQQALQGLQRGGP